MVALLQPAPSTSNRTSASTTTPAPAGSRHLRLVGTGVDASSVGAGPGLGAGAGAGVGGGAGVGSFVGAAGAVSVRSVVVVAAVVFGLLGAIRIAQGSPGGEPGAEGIGSGVVDPPALAVPPVVGPGDRVVVVHPGDTLWSIASALAPGEDPRPMVAALEAANGGPSLQIGQQIVIPEQLLD